MYAQVYTSLGSDHCFHASHFCDRHLHRNHSLSPLFRREVIPLPHTQRYEAFFVLQ